MTPLLNVDTAIEMILKSIQQLDDELIPITKALYRNLTQDIYAQIALPPFTNSAVDGYAVYAEDIAEATRTNGITLPVVMDIPAGQVAPRALARGECARIMTGAVVPDGATCVVKVEDTDSEWEKATSDQIPAQATIYHRGEEGNNIRLVGENVAIGEKIMAKGDVVSVAGIGMLAALGISTVRVVRRPRIVIMSSGDELVGIEDALTPGKIRDVNSYTLAAMCEEIGAEVIRLPVARDSADAIRQLFADALHTKPDVMISSAGVSVGVVDFVRDILEEMGEVQFWRINLRPGKPLAYGKIQGIPFFGLPGNPVSAMVTFDIIVKPALEKLARRKHNEQYVEAYPTHPIESDGRRSYLRVKLQKRDGIYYATETGTQSSGALYSMVLADGLLIVPEDVKYVETNHSLKVKLLKPI